jgi:hypothetical protein
LDELDEKAQLSTSGSRLLLLTLLQDYRALKKLKTVRKHCISRFLRGGGGITVKKAHAILNEPQRKRNHKVFKSDQHYRT